MLCRTGPYAARYGHRESSLMQIPHRTLEPWEEPARGVAGDMAYLTLPGLEQRRTSMARGAVPPIGRLTGMRPVAVDESSCTFEMPATEWLLGPKGVVHTGMLAFLADAPLGGA